jgi:hypothetical protein
MMSELVGDEKPDAHQAEVNARLWSSGRLEFSGPIVPRGEEGQGGSLYYVAIVAS